MQCKYNVVKPSLFYVGSLQRNAAMMASKDKNTTALVGNALYQDAMNDQSSQARYSRSTRTYRIKVGVSPLNRHLHPSVLMMFLVTCKVDGIFSPGLRLMPCILVLIVSKGNVANQEAVPAQPPAIINSLHDSSSSSFSASSISDS